MAAKNDGPCEGNNDDGIVVATFGTYISISYDANLAPGVYQACYRQILYNPWTPSIIYEEK